MGETERAAPRPRLPHAAAIDPSMATTARQVKCGFRLFDTRTRSGGRRMNHYTIDLARVAGGEKGEV